LFVLLMYRHINVYLYFMSK